MIWTVSSRRLLPVVVLISRLAFLPPLAQIPSAPFVHPSLVINSVTLARLVGEYCENGVLYASRKAGVKNASMRLMSGCTGENSCFTMASRSMPKAMAWRTLRLSIGNLVVLIHSPSYDRPDLASTLTPGRPFRASWPGWACGYTNETPPG